MQARDKSGRYDFMDMSLLCECGHALGTHAGVNDTRRRPCFNEDEHCGDGKPCDCQNFRKARRRKKCCGKRES